MTYSVAMSHLNGEPMLDWLRRQEKLTWQHQRAEPEAEIARAYFAGMRDILQEAVEVARDPNTILCAPTRISD